MPTLKFNTAFKCLQQGLTLVELMVTLAIAGILFTVGAPAVSSMMHRYQAASEIQAIQMAIQLTRSQAILSGKTTLCPLVNNVCKREWNLELTAFFDPNGNKKLDSNESVITRVAAVDPSKVLRLYPKRAFQFDSRGFAGFNNGSFSYCRVAGEDHKTGAAFIISRLGRIRGGLDSNEDGLPETANGKNVICPSR